MDKLWIGMWESLETFLLVSKGISRLWVLSIAY